MLPFKFYLGVPPLPFAPRVLLGPGEEIRAWAALAAWLASGLAGMLWFRRFSRS